MRKGFALFIAFFLLAFPALAQKPAFPPLADIPDEFFKEADTFAKSCEADPTMNQYYNCECMGYEYLSARLKAPEAAPSGIMQSINKKCADATGAAGMEYERCLGNAPLLPLNITPEKYCECFANAYAKMFEKYKLGISSKVMVELQTQAHVTCTNPELGRRLYPYQLPGQ